jgi:GT2 family glycosyltransferase
MRPLNAPVRVQDVELTHAMPDVSGSDDQDRRAHHLWLLVRFDRTPVGVVHVPTAAIESPADLAATILATHGDRIVQLAGGLVDPVSMAESGLRRADADALRERRAAIAASAPALTVVVCTRNRPVELARCLDSILRQDYPRFRVVVSDNSSEPGQGTRNVRALDDPRVDTITVPRPGLSHARNAALAAAPGEVIAWIDDDEVADEFWLSEVAEALTAHPDAAIISGAVVPAELATQAQVWFEEFGGHSKGRGFTPAVFSPATWRDQSPLYPLPPFGAGANLVTRPGAIESIGGFDRALGAGSRAMGGEDTLALMRVMLRGGTVAYHPAALTRHFHRIDVDGLRDQLVGYGTGLTAAYTSLLIRQPWRLFQLIGLAPLAVREVVGKSGVREATLSDEFPRDLLRANLRGMLTGPYAYLRGHSRMSR